MLRGNRTDARKFDMLVMLMTVLVVAALGYNLLMESVIAGAGDYLARRWHYEKVLMPKGLSLHKGEYWREKN